MHSPRNQIGDEYPNVQTIPKCQEICFFNDQCKYFTWVGANKTCTLHTQAAENQKSKAPPNSGKVFGSKDCPIPDIGEF